MKSTADSTVSEDPDNIGLAKPGSKRVFPNTYDCVESHPGAAPRANTVQRARFEQRCLNLYEQDKQEHAYYAQEKEKQGQLLFDKRVQSLCEMFPLIDRGLIYGLLSEQEGASEPDTNVVKGNVGGVSKGQAAVTKVIEVLMTIERKRIVLLSNCT